MSARDDSAGKETPLLWRLFIVGRSAVTGVFLAILFVLNGFVIAPDLRALFLAAGLQFATNGLYFWLWKRQDLTFLGYFCFVLEVVLITLLIVALGAEGPMFMLAYLWPIIIGGWMMGHRLVMPLTLLSSLCYAAVVFLQRRDLIPTYTLPPAANGTPQSQVLLLPYLVFVALLVWALTVEVDSSRERLHEQNTALAAFNAKLRSLLGAGQEFLQGHSPAQIRTSAATYARSLTGSDQAAIYAVEGDQLILEHTLGQEGQANTQPARRDIPAEWQATGDEPIMSILLDPDGTADQSGPEIGGMLHIGLRSAHGLEGMLTLGPCEEMPLNRQDNQMLQILGHQFGVAMENARLFSGLTHERNRLRGILANMSEGVCVVDHRGRVSLANRAASEMLSISDGTVAPAWLLESSGHKDTEDDSHRQVEMEERTVRVSSASLEHSEGKPSSTIFVIYDVTHEAQVERMKSDFVAYASHELRTPLATVKMLVGLLTMDVKPESKARQYLDKINMQVNRQHRLVNNLLDMTRLESGRYELQQDSVSPSQIIASVCQTCRPLAESKSLAFDIDTSNAPDLMVTNASALEQVLTNLASNAIKFTDEGGVSINCETSDDRISFSVRDTGVGLTQEELGRIFDKFYTVRHPKKRGEGTGLGLAISNMIVEQLGGSIAVESTPGEGSLFQVAFGAD